MSTDVGGEKSEYVCFVCMRAEMLRVVAQARRSRESGRHYWSSRSRSEDAYPIGASAAPLGRLS